MMGSTFVYVLVTIVVVVTFSVNILQDSGNMTSKKTNQLCSKLNVMFQSKDVKPSEKEEANKHNLKAVYLIGCKDKGKASSTPRPEKRSSGGALLDLLDYVGKPLQTKPIYAPSVLLPKNPPHFGSGINFRPLENK